ncbi:MAG: hypothetical protein WCK27_31240, partial [Verrucomicrobiota bacterium]
MKQATDKAAEPKMRAEYDFSRGIRGKYARRYGQGAKVVVLEADVAKVFPNAEAVNDSLRVGGHHPAAAQGTGRQVSR